MILEWTKNASIEVENIKNYIREDSEYYANIFGEKIIEIVENLILFPKMGHVVPEINKINIREVIYQNYRILYEVGKEQILILSVIHGARDLRKKKNRNWEIN